MPKVTVGAPSRAETFTLSSERGFVTITGRYKGIPISVVSIGMGSPNMDFFVREVRECLVGDMVVIRFVHLLNVRNVSLQTIIALVSAPVARLWTSQSVLSSFPKPVLR